MSGGISAAEVLYVRQGIAEGVRNDGRSPLQHRRVWIEDDTVQQSNGSASCTIGGTRVIVAVAADIGVPFPDAPNQGDIQCSVDISPCALQGPYTDAAAAALGKCLQRSLRWQTHGPGCALDLKKLIIISGKRCWVLSVDALIISMDGNVLGALSIATKAALRNLKIPRVDVDYGEDQDEPELDLDDDMENASLLDTSKVPLILTVHNANGTDVVDLTEEEELACSGTAVRIGVNPKGTVGYVETAGSQSLPPEKLLAKVKVAQSLASQLHKLVDSSSRPQPGSV